MLTLDELKEALSVVEIGREAHEDDTGNCISCGVSIADYGPGTAEPHREGCRYVRVRDALRRAIEKHRGDDAPAYAYHAEGYEDGYRDGAADCESKIRGWLRRHDAGDSLNPHQRIADAIERGEHWK